MHDLPWLGLGLSANLDGRAQPHPYRLADARPGLFDFVEYSAPLELAEARAAPLFAELEARRERLPAVFHPVHLNLYGPELEPPARLAALDAQARAVGSPWVGNDVGWWHQGGAHFPGYLYLPPPLTEAGLADAAEHARHVQAHVSVPLVLENPAVPCVEGPMHVLDFMAALHARTGLGLLLDLGHLLSHQLARGLPPEAGLEGFPLEAVVELHLAGGVITRAGGRAFYADDHSQPVREELFALLERVLPRCTNLRAVTFEGDGHPEALAARTLERLRRVVASPRASGAAPPPLRGHGRAGRGQSSPGAESWAPRSGPWEVYARAYAGAPGPDPEGQRADADYRLAVLAEELDALLPWTRLLLAGDRAGLAAFAGSAEFRSRFEAGKPLGQAFAAWARRRIREARDDGAAAALSFESLALHAVSHAGPAGLACGARLARFPVDLSELHWAASALRRHLAGRAWAGELPSGAGEGLSQAARRASPGPWPVALLQRGPGFEVVPLSPGLAALLEQAAAGQPPPAGPEAEQARALGLL